MAAVRCRKLARHLSLVTRLPRHSLGGGRSLPSHHRGHSFTKKNESGSQVKVERAVPSAFGMGPSHRLGDKPIHLSHLSLVTRHRSLLSIGVPMFSDHAILDAKHIEPERLMMLTVFAGPGLSHVDDHHVVVTNHIQ